MLCALVASGCGERLGMAIGPAADGGTDLVQDPASTVNAISGQIGGIDCAAGRGAVFIKEAGGRAWEAVSLQAADQKKLNDIRLFGVSCPSKDAIVAVGSVDSSPPVPQVAVLTRKGTWRLKLHKPVSNGDLFAISGAKPNELMAVGYRLGGGTPTSLAIKTSDPVFGVWKEDTRLTKWQPLHALWVRPDGERVAVGASGTLLHSGGDAQPYSGEVNPRGAPTMRAVWAPANQPFVAVGDEGTLLQRVSKGTWRVMPGRAGKSINWRAVHGSSQSNIYAVGGHVIAHHDGIEWKKLSNISGLPSELDLHAVRLDAGRKPPRLHLAGDRLLTTCDIGKGSPPALVCRR